MPKIIRPWTRLEEHRLVELRRSGHTAAMIAPILNRSRIAIERRLARFPLRSPRRAPGAFNALVARTWREGRSDRDIARILRTSPQRVWRARRAIGLPPGLPPALSWTRRIHNSGHYCWVCNRRAPKSLRSWHTRPIGHYRNKLRECYCPDCFALHGWPPIPPRQYERTRAPKYAPRVYTCVAS